MSAVRTIAFPITDITQLKVVLASWYSFLREEIDNLSSEEFSDFLKTPVMYNISEDNLEVLFCGTEEILQKFKMRYSKSSENK